MEVKKKIVIVEEQHLITPAKFEDRDTGDKREQRTIKVDGTEVIEHVPVIQRVFFDAVYETVNVEKLVYSVSTIIKARPGQILKTEGGIIVDELTEEHDFATAEDAERFITDTMAANARKNGGRR